jgi:hypothetical protein
MTKNEVKSLMGSPANSTYGSEWVYGRYYIKFDNNVVNCILNENPRFSCAYYRSSHSYAVVK